ncbi:MAG: hydrogenase expression/formation C-terminal domain-containing protein [Rudaea sp.]
MSRLGQIPIRVEPLAAPTPAAAIATGTIGAGVTAILFEIAAHLDRLADDGESNAIDLRSLPMSPSDREALVQALGSGEVAITLQADGESIIRETSVPGVWWNEHRDRGGELIAAFIEIARVPAMLPVETDELRRGACQLRLAIAGTAQ